MKIFNVSKRLLMIIENEQEILQDEETAKPKFKRVNLTNQ